MTVKYCVNTGSRSVRPCVTRRLIKECKTLQSRVSAILACPSAVRSLSQEDVFGQSYERLLRQDIRCLEQAINAGERELNETAEL